METNKISNIDFNSLLSESREYKSALGAAAWVTLEMFKQAGMSAEQRDNLYQQMGEYFAKPSNEICNTVVKVLEQRLKEDKNSSGDWY